jgi:exonuclease VII small subunit
MIQRANNNGGESEYRRHSRELQRLTEQLERGDLDPLEALAAYRQAEEHFGALERIVAQAADGFRQAKLAAAERTSNAKRQSRSDSAEPDVSGMPASDSNESRAAKAAPHHKTAEAEWIPRRED